VNYTSYEAPHNAVFSSLQPLSSLLGPNIVACAYYPQNKTLFHNVCSKTFDTDILTVE